MRGKQLKRIETVERGTRETDKFRPMLFEKKEIIVLRMYKNYEEVEKIIYPDNFINFDLACKKAQKWRGQDQHVYTFSIKFETVVEIGDR